MRTKYIGNYFVLVILMVCFISITARAELSIEDIQAGIKLRQKKLNSVHVKFRYEVFNDTAEGNTPTFLGMHLVRAKEYDLKRLDEKKKVVERRESVITGEINRIERYAWDGKKSTGYAEIPNKPELRRSGTVLSEEGHIFETVYWQTPLEQETFDLRCSLAETFDKSSWTLVKTEMIDGYDTYLIESNGIRFANSKLQAWIAPAKDFAPVRMILTIKLKDDKGFIEEMRDVHLEKKDDIWVITDATLVFEDQIRGRKFATRFIAKEYDVGVDLTSENFNIDFPHGTLVYDDILEVGYIVGEGKFVCGSKGVISDGCDPNLSEPTKK